MHALRCVLMDTLMLQARSLVGLLDGVSSLLPIFPDCRRFLSSAHTCESDVGPESVDQTLPEPQRDTLVPPKRP